MTGLSTANEFPTHPRKGSGALSVKNPDSQGPAGTDIPINWMISRGLKGYGSIEKADAMKRDILQLPIR